MIGGAGRSFTFDRTRKRLQKQIDEGLFTPGAQLVVEVQGERVLDLALGDDGIGRPMSPEHVLRVYCTIKPVTALAIARLVDADAISLDEPLVTRLPDLRSLAGGVSLRHLLSHTAGLHRPAAVQMELLTPEGRRDAIARAQRPSDWRLGVDAAYSEAAAWHVLGWLLEAVTGEPLREHLRRTVLDPLELHSTWVGMTAQEYQEVVPRLGVNVDRQNLNNFPILFERGRRVCMETNPAHGGYTNARDLASFYSALLSPRDGEGAVLGLSASTLERFCSPARPRTYDLILGRECDYGLGFMTDLSDHAFGSRCGTGSFGHSGNVGASFAFADPARDLAVGVVFNGVVGSETAFLRRRSLVNDIYRDLDDIDGPPIEEQANRSLSRFRLARLSRR